MKDEDLETRTGDLGTELLHSYFARHEYRTMAVGKVCHKHVPSGSVDASGGRGGMSDPTGDLFANYHHSNTQTDWSAVPDSLEPDFPDYQAADWAINQLSLQHDRPFMLMVGFMRPHVPFYAPQRYFDRYDPEAITLPPYLPGDLDDLPSIAQSLVRPEMPRTEWAIANNQWRNIVHSYLACISFADEQVGRVLDALENSPYRDDTIIVLWSDHGYHMGEKNTFQKHALWERSTHVPLLFVGPSIPEGIRCSRVVSLLDIYPTLVELTNLPINSFNEGRSLVPLINNPSIEWPHPALTEFEDHYAVRNERYRYIRYTDGSEELYDHATDPDEWINLAGQPEYAAIKAELAAYIP
jgi:arylsulfatase A-like enzyme